MTNIKFLKTLTTGVTLAIAFYPQAWAEILENIACGDNCLGTYDTESRTMTFTGSGVIEPQWKDNLADLLGLTQLWQHGVRNIIIGEGFNRVEGYALTTASSRVVVGGNIGTIKFPSTWRGASGTYEAYFGTYEITPTNSETKLSLDIQMMPSAHTVIITPSDNMIVNLAGSLGGNPTDITVLCKGKTESCQNMIRKASNQTNVSYAYYTGLDDDGNWEVWSDDGLALYADSTKQKLLAKYDLDGNQTGVYKYDGAGNLTAAIENGVATYKRTSYTPAEAAAAVKKGNVNKVTLIFK